MKVITEDKEVMKMIELNGLQKLFEDKNQTVVAIGKHENNVAMFVWFAHPTDSGYGGFLFNDNMQPAQLFEAILMLLARLNIRFDSAQILKQIQICKN